MNGVVLLMALAAPAVDYSFRTTADRQQEYTIQIEPEVLKLVSSGQQIDSDVPPEAGQIQRLCIRIGMTPATHTAAGEQLFRQLLVSAGRVASADRALVAADNQATILWPARANPEQSFGVTHGWQPDTQGQLAYYVQIDPTTLRTLTAGDEIHATIDPAAGRVARFVVSAGNKQLPQVAAATLPSAAPPLVPGSTVPLAGASSRTRFRSDNDANTSPLANMPSAGPLTRVGDYGPVPAADPSTGRSSWGGASTDYSRPPAGGTQFNSGNPPQPPSTSYNPRELAPLEPPRTGYSDVGNRGPATGYSPSPWDNQVADNRGNVQPPTNMANGYDRPRSTMPPQMDYAPVQTYGPPAAGQQPQLSQTQLQQGYATGGPQPQTRYSPQMADNRVATLPPGTNMAPVSNPSMLSSATNQATAEKSWGPFILVTFALFFSIGGNLYLAYTALEFHHRYRSAIDRLRSAARSS
jgi:hypothetical protein